MHVCTDECFKIQDISIILSDSLRKVLCRRFYAIQYAYFESIGYWAKCKPNTKSEANAKIEVDCFIFSWKNISSILIVNSNAAVYHCDFEDIFGK